MKSTVSTESKHTSGQESPAGTGEAKKRGRPFEPGNMFSRGRPQGSRNRKTVRALKLFEDHAAALMALAINGCRNDPQMLRTFLSRILPRSRDLPVKLGRLPLTTSEDLNRASEKTLQKALAGKISPSEAREISAMIEDRRRVIEMLDSQQRFTVLEQRESINAPEPH
jgi:hypothetical protein